MGQNTNRSYRNSIDSNRQLNTPKDLPTFVNYFYPIKK